MLPIGRLRFCIERQGGIDFCHQTLNGGQQVGVRGFKHHCKAQLQGLYLGIRQGKRGQRCFRGQLVA